MTLRESVNGDAVTAAPTVEAGFDVTSEMRDDAAWLIAAGELDIASAASLDEELRAVAPGTPLFLDLRELTFCDSTGLAILLRARRRRRALTILLGPATTRVANIAGVTGLLLDA
jgi:anti-sigma B factor antagonist